MNARDPLAALDHLDALARDARRAASSPLAAQRAAAALLVREGLGEAPAAIRAATDAGHGVRAALTAVAWWPHAPSATPAQRAALAEAGHDAARRTGQPGLQALLLQHRLHYTAADEPAPVLAEILQDCVVLWLSCAHQANAAAMLQQLALCYARHPTDFPDLDAAAIRERAEAAALRIDALAPTSPVFLAHALATYGEILRLHGDTASAASAVRLALELLRREHTPLAEHLRPAVHALHTAIRRGAPGDEHAEVTATVDGSS